MSSQTRSFQKLYAGLLLCLLLLVFFLFNFGVDSVFFLDDPGNLETLTHITEYNLEQIALFSLSGFSGPTGRPLSLLTFALQYADWPDNPSAFKFVNIMIHLINTGLVFIVSKTLFQFQYKTRRRALHLSLVTAAIWAIHPIQVTTVLYCIQRMTELSALFVLLGLYLYLLGRSQLLGRQPTRAAYIWMTIGLISGIGLSMLCKENGVLILLYILVIEKTLLQDSTTDQGLRRWQQLFVYLPITLAIGYLWYHFDAEKNFLHRNFTFVEHLLTENAVVFDYLNKIFIPRFHSFSLYHDDFPVSKSLTDSFQTLAGFLIISSSICLAILYRKRFPLIAFGILWFFSGHALESTFLSLELYYEHRNYLPLLGIVIASVTIAYNSLQRVDSKILRKTLILCLFLYGSYLTYLTYTQTSLWGKGQQAKLIWALEKPKSTRAQSAAANVMAYYGNYQQALKFTQKIIELSPNDPSPYLAWLQFRCNESNIPHPPMDRLFQLAEKGDFNLSSLFILNTLVLDMEAGHCQKLDYQEISTLFEKFQLNPKLTKQADFFQIYAMFEGDQGHYLKALNLANRSLHHQQSVRVALFQLRWLTLMGDHRAAYQYLDRVKEINNSRPKTAILYQSTIKEWEEYLLRQLSQ